MIHVTPHARRALRLPWRALLANKAREFGVKLRGGRIKGQGMIGAPATTVAAGFKALRADDFVQYNLPQAWVERRQIPIAIHGRIPRQHAVVLDLGCGPGTSTEVLCYFADPTWTVLGYDLTDHYIERAAARSGRGEFRNHAGQRISPRFACQDISQPLASPDGGLVAGGSVDYALSAGVVGLYMNEESAARLASELARVVKPGGFVALDAGPAVPVRALKRILIARGFRYLHRARSFWIEPRPKLVFQRIA
ncbi:hypothetical protein PHYC_01853 [Phycisphaerales bacterium]|nr:hypothetical protein PHYC_01853 [Phycisphaerales bacterium]